MKRKTNKRNINKLTKYTAVVPKTLKATRHAGTAVVKKIRYFLKNSVKTVKKTTKMLDRRVAKSIRSLTKKRFSK